MEPNKEQLEAITCIEGPVLIIAGAGSGKTSTLIHRTAHIIKSGVAPENILMMTFTNKAAKEMKERGMKLLDERFTGVYAGTYHSFCSMLLRRYAQRIGMVNDFFVLSDSDSEDLVKLLMSKTENSKARTFPRASKLVNIFSATRSRNKPIEEIMLIECPTAIEHLETIKALFREYQSYKFKHSQMDYDDIIDMTIRLLVEFPHIQQKIANQYKYIMVDEYQDSNYPQLQLLKALCRGKECPNICAVGDDQQSIYLFRGSEFMNIINYPKEFPGCKCIILNKNYRSTQEILDVSNDIIEDAEQKYDKYLESSRTGGPLPIIVRPYSRAQEATWALERIKKYHQSGIPYSEIAVITRTSIATGILEANMTAEQVPYRKFGGSKFVERRFVKDISAILRAITDTTDEIAWFRILKLVPRISDAFANKIFQKIREQNSMEGMVDSDFEKRPFFEHLNDFYTTLSNPQTKDFSVLYQGAREYYFDIRKKKIEFMKTNSKADSEKIKEEERALRRDEEDCSISLDIVAQKYMSAQSFVSDLSLENIFKKDETGDYVTISTVHSVKGLEFKVVIVYECVEGIFPFTKNEDTIVNPYAAEYAKLEMEEERRILYVAITRAKDHLLIMCPYMLYPMEGEINRYLYPAIKKGHIKIQDV